MSPDELTLTLLAKSSGDLHAVYMLGRQVVIQAACLTTTVFAGITRAQVAIPSPKARVPIPRVPSASRCFRRPPITFRSALLLVMFLSTGFSIYQALNIWDANLLPGKFLLQHLQ
jgi:hypothetical protein